MSLSRGIVDADTDNRIALLKKVVIYADMSIEDQRVVTQILQQAYDKYVLQPTRSTWRKDTKEDPDWSRKMLEREVERTNLMELSAYIKAEVDAALGPLWHVAYGRDLAAYVTHERMSYIHANIDGANVIVWRHGR